MFQPVLPFTGYVGWRFLERTLETQQDTFSNSSTVTRSTDHFRERIAKVQSAEDLVNDRQLLEVALGAFGLSDDIGNTHFIKRILSDGTTADDALSNRLADKRYRAFSKAFGFGEITAPKTTQFGFADRIIDQYSREEFARAVGDQNNDLRLALHVAPALQEVSEQASTTDGQWFLAMGNPPLRKVLEMALGLPSSFAQIDIDQQLSTFKERATATFGTNKVSELMQPEQQEKLIRLFLIRSEAATSALSNGANAALTLLRSAPPLF